MYESNDKMYTLMSSGHQLLQIISRFGIALGVGEKTIEEVCREYGLDTDTILAVINHDTHAKVDIPTLMIYVRNAHSYFLEFQMPRIKQELIAAISHLKMEELRDARTRSIPLLIIQFFDRYVEEVRKHIQLEERQDFHQHATADESMTHQLSELKQLITKYFPGNGENSMLYAALTDIFEIEAELALHCSIEDDILLPALKRKNATKNAEEELSDRERDVLIQVVNGLSNKEIADVLNISTHTVISHRKNIARKLNIHSSAGLTIYAIVNKLVCLDELKNT